MWQKLLCSRSVRNVTHKSLSTVKLTNKPPSGGNTEIPFKVSKWFGGKKLFICEGSGSLENPPILNHELFRIIKIIKNKKLRNSNYLTLESRYQFTYIIVFLKGHNTVHHKILFFKLIDLGSHLIKVLKLEVEKPFVIFSTIQFKCLIILN